MATVEAKKSRLAADPTVGEEVWTGGRLTLIGVITLLVAFTILYIISGSATPH